MNGIHEVSGSIPLGSTSLRPAGFGPASRRLDDKPAGRRLPRRSGESSEGGRPSSAIRRLGRHRPFGIASSATKFRPRAVAEHDLSRQCQQAAIRPAWHSIVCQTPGVGIDGDDLPASSGEAQVSAGTDHDGRRRPAPGDFRILRVARHCARPLPRATTVTSPRLHRPKVPISRVIPRSAACCGRQEYRAPRSR